MQHSHSSSLLLYCALSLCVGCVQQCLLVQMMFVGMHTSSSPCGSGSWFCQVRVRGQTDAFTVDRGQEEELGCLLLLQDDSGINNPLARPHCSLFIIYSSTSTSLGVCLQTLSFCQNNGLVQSPQEVVPNLICVSGLFLASLSQFA